MRLLDNFLNSVTMYRLMLYYLILLLAASAVFGFFGLVPFAPTAIILSAAFLVFVCVFSNTILAKILKVPTNLESSYITAIILVLILSPAQDLKEFGILLTAGIIAVLGKYILLWKRKHIFNPAAAAVVATGFILGGYASWWVGTTYMFPFLLLGILIIRKVKRHEQILAFFGTALLLLILLSLIRGNNLLLVLQNTFFESPILFFAFVMFTEPLTSPTRRMTQIIYGVIIGGLYSSQISFLGFYVTPEIALLCGNLFAYFVGMRERLVLKLKSKSNLGANIYEYIFDKPLNFSFIPGQYLEWTLSHKKSDARGNRRYFTIASSPTEDAIRIGTRCESAGSSFKKALNDLEYGREIMAGQLSGDFVLPSNKKQKLAFIAGGIGITPYRSIVKYLIDKNEKRDIILLYINKTENDEVYKDVFEQASKIGVTTEYLLEHVSGDILKTKISDYKARKFFISGSHLMVEDNKKILKQMGVKSEAIITDYFPGYA